MSLGFAHIILFYPQKARIHVFSTYFGLYLKYVSRLMSFIIRVLKNSFPIFHLTNRQHLQKTVVISIMNDVSITCERLPQPFKCWY